MTPLQVLESLPGDTLLTRTPQHYLETNSERAVEAASANGYVVCFPGPNELQIDLDDLDGTDNEARHLRSMDILRREFGVTADNVKWTPSKSGAGAHVRITMPFPLDPWQRIALQAAMGSDPVRELLSAVRLMAGDPNPTLLFETKEVASQLGVTCSN